MPDLVGDIKKRLTLGEREESIRADLLAKGYLEEDVTLALSRSQASAVRMQQRNALRAKTRGLTLKEIFDRLAFGLGSQQFINILLFQTGASLFLIGILNGLKVFFHPFINSYLDESFHYVKRLKTRMVVSGMFNALAFLAFGASIALHDVALFAVSVILGGIFGEIHGSTYDEFLTRTLGTHKTPFLQRHATLGLFIAGVALVIGGLLLDQVVDGYLLLFIIIFFSLVIALLAFLRTRELPRKDLESGIRISLFGFLLDLFKDIGPFFSDKAIIILLLTGSITSFIQVLGYSYYGIFIWEALGNTGFGPFMNVALIFVFALLGTFAGNFITQSNAKEYGKFPLLVFGTILMAIMPLTYFYNPNLLSVAMATILGVVGSSIVGIARSILAVEIVPLKERASFFRLSGLLSSLPLLLFIPLGAWYADAFYFRKLFLLLGMILILIVVPLYMYILLAHDRNKI
ncbi:MAG: MFS transporter [DPANN group archaeon]|nr:MFS transporter [DPANN group archaeon]